MRKCEGNQIILVDREIEKKHFEQNMRVLN